MKAVVIMMMLASSPMAAQQDYAKERERLVRDHIAARGIKDPRVLKVMRETPRHLFVPKSIENRAYHDTPLPIGFNQTISQPYIVASMTEMLDCRAEHKVLEIGTGSGYQAAVLAPLVAKVYTIEVVEPLARQSAALLKMLGHDNIEVRYGDGYAGWPEQAPFDRIILTAAPPEIPKTLIDHLKPGGRLVAPEGREWQELIVIDKDQQGRVKRRRAYGVMFVPMVKGKRD
jgi:protein-L-isoaspartate(D-aspartate) O-methyltransferase